MGNESSKFCEELDRLASLARDLRSNDISETQTCAWLVEPFLMTLGYDKGDPRVVIPQFGTAKWGDDKVDYALLGNDNEPLILVECKRLGTALDRDHWKQLYRYYGDTDARVGILTNGVTYEVYLDNNKQNIMDEEPFFEFDLIDADDAARRTVGQLARLEDGTFDMEGFRESATKWTITSKFKPGALDVFAGWLTHVDEEFVTLLETRLGAPEGSLGELIREWFAEFADAHSPQGGGSTVPPPLPPPPPTPSEAMPLPEWKHMKDDPLPIEILFPDNSSRPINDGYDVLVQSVGWLKANHHIDQLPIRRPRAKRYLVSETPIHPTGKDMTMPKEISGVFVEAHASVRQNADNAQFVIRHARQQPTQFKVRFS